MYFKLLFLIFLAMHIKGDSMHPRFNYNQDGTESLKAVPIPGDDQNPQKWLNLAEETLKKALAKKNNHKIAKNVILFLEDGMGISTLTAGRIYKGQLEGRTGEEELTFMEQMNTIGLSKTYNIDAQTPDSAGTATAYLTGVKSRIGSIGVDGRAYDCNTTLTSKLDSILKWAKSAGKSTGIVTTTRVTHATPSAAYASIFNREMEAFDGANFGKKEYDLGCRDIADQLVEFATSINVVFAGGRRKFMHTTEADPANPKIFGDRIDNRSLITEWNTKMANANLKHKYIWNIDDFQQVKANEYDHVLGLLSFDHMDFELDRVKNSPPTQPSIVEMTDKAIQLLQTNPNGFFLLVEGGKIDHAHHGSNAKNSLHDFSAFDEAIGAALENIGTSETHITVTADHSHVFTIGGYPGRGNNILGIVKKGDKPSLSNNKLTYTTLLYANGPGFFDYKESPSDQRTRQVNLDDLTTTNDSYMQESAVPMSSETHGAEDVGIFSSGPMSYLLNGVVEQNYIAHVMAYSACIGPYNTDLCRQDRGGSTTTTTTQKYNSSPMSKFKATGFFFKLQLLVVAFILANY